MSRLAAESQRGAARERPAPATSHVEVVDTPEDRVHHPSDLLGVVVSALSVVLVLVIAVYAQGTTEGVTEDVRSFAVLLRRLLFLPVTVLEGVLTVVMPLLVLGELALRRLGRQVLETLVAGAAALLVALALTWGIREWGANSLVAPLSVWVRGEYVLTLPSYVAGVAAMLTVAGPRTRRRTVSWSWNLLWVALVVALITGELALPGALTALLVGRLTGLAVRYASGVASERAYGPSLLAGVRRAGFEPHRLVRVRPGDEAIGPATRALTRHGDTRVYSLLTTDGERLDLVALDGDRQVIGFLARTWRSLRLRGIEGRAVVSLRQAAERAALLAYAARAAGVRTPRVRAMAQAADSMLIVQEQIDAVPLREVDPDELDDAALDSVWAELRRAHAAGLTHRALTADVVLLARDEDGGHRAWLAGWEQGDIASSELARRLDLTQMIALLAARVGPDAAVASAERVLPDEDFASIAPLLQTIALPRSTREEMRADRGLLVRLRTALVDRLPVATVPPVRLVRVGARTILTLALTIIAVVVIVTTMNFSEIADALRSANPLWTLVALLAGLLTFLGAAMALIGFSPVPLPLGRMVLVQAASAFVSLAAPAGVGPAAMNLRVLTKRGVGMSLAVASVALVQVSSLVVTVALLIMLSVVSGSDGALRQLPSPTVLGALGVVAGGVALAMLVPRVRQWVIARTMPTVRQTWPRLVQILGQPLKLTIGLGGNLVMAVGYLTAFYASLAAFGQHVPLLDMAVIYLLGNTLGSTVPSPGGLGTIEFALFTGLSTTGGLTPAIATSVVVLFRALTYWTRVPLGWLSMRYLTRVGEL